MIFLDQLLLKLKAGDHKVLIFSQMTKVLYIIQQFLEFRGFNFERLDSSTPSECRSASIDRFASICFDRQGLPIGYKAARMCGGETFNLSIEEGPVFKAANRMFEVRSV